MIKLVNVLNAEFTLPPTITLKRIPLEFKVPWQPLIGKFGGVKTGKTTVASRQFVLEGRHYCLGDKKQLKDWFDALASFLVRPPIVVYKDDRFLVTEALGASQEWIDKGVELGLSIPMLALNPYWQGEIVTKTIDGTQSVVVDGNTLTVPLITTADSVSSLQVSNSTTNQQISISGIAGQIAVESAGLTLTVDGINRIDCANDEWLIRGFELLPGNNMITTNEKINLVYRPRWI